MSPKIDLTDDDWSIVEQILVEFANGIPVYAFGSRAKGTAQRYSDLDLALHSKDGMGLMRLSALKQAFDDSELSINVDVVDLAAVSSAFAERILQECVPLNHER